MPTVAIAVLSGVSARWWLTAGLVAFAVGALASLAAALLALSGQRTVEPPRPGGSRPGGTVSEWRVPPTRGGYSDERSACGATLYRRLRATRASPRTPSQRR